MANSYTYQTDPTSGVSFVEFDGLRVVKAEFPATGKGGATSDKAGLKYHYPEYDSLDTMLQALGSDIVVDTVNNVLRNQSRNKAAAKFANNMPEDPSKKAEYLEILKKNPELIDVDDAKTYKPGDRELSLSGLFRKLQKITAEQMEATRTRNTAALQGIVEKQNALFALLEKAMKEQADAAASFLAEEA